MSINRKNMPRATVVDGASPFTKHHERIAATLANPRAAAFSGLNAGVDPARIAAALEDANEAARLAVEAAKASGEIAKRADQRVNGLQANLQAVEQVIAGAQARSTGIIGASHTGQTIGAALVQKSEAGEFDGLSSMRNGNSPKASVKLGTSIRAALVHEGSGSSSGSGIMPSTPETGHIVGPALRPLGLLDVLSFRATERDAVEHIRLGTTGDAGEQFPEGAEKSEVEFSGTSVRAEICTIAAVTHASRQVLQDHTALQGVIDGTLRGKVTARLEHQLLNGDGSPGKIAGLIGLAAQYIPTATAAADRIGEAVAGLRGDGYQPSVIVMHPSDWFAIAAERGQDQHYTLGLPTAPIQPSLWGCAVVQSSSMAQGTALVLDPAFSTVLERQAIEVALSEHHDKHFVRNLIAIRCELRAGLEFTDVDSAWVFSLSAEASS